jgi:hypothetical protein
MNRDEILKIAAEAGAFPELSETPEKDVAFLQRFAALIEQHLSYDSIHTCHAECQRPACIAVREAVATAIEPLQERIRDLYRQLGEAEKQLDQQYKMGAEAKLDECILILERLYERSGEQYKQYLHAARVLKGEI